MISAREAYDLSRGIDKEALKRKFKENFEEDFADDLKNIEIAIKAASKNGVTTVYYGFDCEDRNNELYIETLREYLGNLGYDTEFETDSDDVLMVVISWREV